MDQGGRMVQAIMRAWGAADEASLAGPPLTSCCAAQFLTGHRPAPVRGLGTGDPFSSEFKTHTKQTALDLTAP